MPAPSDETVLRPAAPLDDEDRYEVLATVAVGGMGQVWRVRDRLLGTVVVMKLAMEPIPQYNGRIEREAAVLERMTHPNIVVTYESGFRRDGTAFYTMEYVEGPTLEAELARCRTLHERLGLLPYLRDACRAVGHAHRTRVVHRDLKPSNLVIDRSGPWALAERGRIVVIDWGLALDFTAPGATIPGAILGTAGYMPPEQASARRDLQDSPADVWALGAVLYEVVTGRPPFEGGAREVVRMTRYRPPPRVSEIRGIDPSLARIVDRALEFDPNDRYATADALADALDAWLHDVAEAPRGAGWGGFVALVAIAATLGVTAVAATSVATASFMMWVLRVAPVAESDQLPAATHEEVVAVVPEPDPPSAPPPELGPPSRAPAPPPPPPPPPPPVPTEPARLTITQAQGWGAVFVEGVRFGGIPLPARPLPPDARSLTIHHSILGRATCELSVEPGRTVSLRVASDRLLVEPASAARCWRDP
jgi:hypothetical protein